MKRFIKYLNYLFDFFMGFFWVTIKSNESHLAQYLRKNIYRTPCLIDTDVIIKNKNNFKAGINSALYHSSYILNDFGQFSMGNNSHMGAFCYVNVCYGNVEIGDDVAIGPGTKIIAYSNHYAKGKKITEERKTGNIFIGRNVFIGANCILLPGTIISDNVIVGANSLVKGKLESNAIYAGIPSKKLKEGWF